MDKINVTPMYRQRYNPTEKDSLQLSFPKGSVLIIQEKNNNFYLVGRAPYEDNIDPQDEQIRKQYTEAFLQSEELYYRDLSKDNLTIEVVAPLATTALSIKNAIPMSKKDYYSDENGYLFTLYSACQTAFDSCTRDTFKIVFWESAKDKDAILYLGYTVEENYDLSPFTEVFDGPVTVQTYGEYKQLSNEYINSHFDLSKESDKEKKAQGLYFPLLNKIRTWLSETPYKEFHAQIEEYVKGQPALELLLVCVHNYLDNLANERRYRSNLLLAAPSGSGKTETFRALRDYFKDKIPLLPVIQIDMSQLTEAGYKGRNTDEIFRVIDAKNTFGIALVFLDELDKKLLPSYGSSGINYNAAVQAELLTMLEGSVITSKDGKSSIDTANTMFIGLGSFDYTRKQKAKKAEQRTIGFGGSLGAYSEHYENISIEDVIRQGASYELMGRFSLLINYGRLSPDAINRIIDQTANELSEAPGVPLRLSAKARDFLLTQANSKYGCRRLKSSIEAAAYPAYNSLLLSGNDKRDFEIIMEDSENAYFQRRMNYQAHH